MHDPEQEGKAEGKEASDTEMTYCGAFRARRAFDEHALQKKRPE